MVLRKDEAMKNNDEILKEVAGLSARERAAAIGHYVYIKTSEQVGWGTRVPVDWENLSDDARAFNLASIDTWIRERALLDAWNSALEELQ